MTSLLHSLLVLTSIILTYFWTRNKDLSYYNLQITGLIIIFYFVTRLLIQKMHRISLTLDAMVFTSLTLLLIINTGAAHSPVFFLLYFLLFAISLLFEPFQAGLVTVAILIIFLFGSWPNFDNQSLINLATLILVTPLAIILGKKYLETLENLGKIQILNQIISKEETDSLLWLSTQAKPTLASLIEQVNDLPDKSDSLQKIKEDLTLLYKSTETLKGAISDN